jgi:sterol desaturase/sphingolipid hydroxylase (fatty acid hydroxylase superfamily)
MKDILNKLSSYNIFNNLFPGILFVLIADVITSYSFIQKDIVLGIFLYYFIGLVISRIGSIIIEPFLKFTSFIHFKDYKDFVKAEKEDPKIDLLSEVNNMYRTLCSLFLMLLLLLVFEKIAMIWAFLNYNSLIILIIALLVLFMFSYRKQSKYISDRIDSNKK